MTHKEMSEIFAVMLLAYPNAEVFKGGIAKLGPTINLWVTCLPEIDFWTGQQAVVKLVRECKFPPTIAEFKEKAEKVQAEVRARIDQAWNYLKLDTGLSGGVPADIHYVHRNNLHQPVAGRAHIEAGADAIVVPDILLGAVNPGGDGVTVGQVDDHDLLGASLQVGAEFLVAHVARRFHRGTGSGQLLGRPRFTHKYCLPSSSSTVK